MARERQVPDPATGDRGNRRKLHRFARDGEGESFRLEVEDDGCGLQDGGQPKGTGLGSRLVAAMARSLSSKIDYDSSYSGCRAVLVAAI